MTETRRPWVLLAEDSGDDAALTERAFRPWASRFRVVRAWDGQQAREAILREGTPPRLVVLDLKMPKVSGLEVLHTLSVRDGAYPVAILTSSNERRDREACEAIACDGFYVKPVDYEAYLEVARELFARFLGDSGA